MVNTNILPGANGKTHIHIIIIQERLRHRQIGLTLRHAFLSPQRKFVLARLVDLPSLDPDIMRRRLHELEQQR